MVPKIFGGYHIIESQKPKVRMYCYSYKDDRVKNYHYDIERKLPAKQSID